MPPFLTNRNCEMRGACTGRKRDITNWIYRFSTLVVFSAATLARNQTSSGLLASATINETVSSLLNVSAANAANEIRNRTSSLFSAMTLTSPSPSSNPSALSSSLHSVLNSNYSFPMNRTTTNDTVSPSGKFSGSGCSLLAAIPFGQR